MILEVIIIIIMIIEAIIIILMIIEAIIIILMIVEVITHAITQTFRQGRNWTQQRAERSTQGGQNKQFEQY